MSENITLWNPWCIQLFAFSQSVILEAFNNQCVMTTDQSKQTPIQSEQIPNTCTSLLNFKLSPKMFCLWYKPDIVSEKLEIVFNRKTHILQRFFPIPLVDEPKKNEYPAVLFTFTHRLLLDIKNSSVRNEERERPENSQFPRLHSWHMATQ